MDLEREKGITILAKNTAVRYGDLTINIVDTPGHADFGGEVERGLTMVDGVLLLVDASEGPLPQTRFVLRKTLEARLPGDLVINKIDRPDARPAEVHRRRLRAVHRPRAPTSTRSTSRSSTATPGPGRPALAPEDVADSPGPEGAVRPAGRAHPGARPTTRAIRSRPWSPTWTPRRTWAGWPCAGSATARVQQGRAVAWCRHDGTIERVRLSELYVTEALDRVDAPPEGAGPGDIIAVAGIPEIMIGDTLADPDDPRPLPVITVDEPEPSA